MKRVVLMMSSALLFAAASAGQSDPALDDLSVAGQGPSELDALSEGTDTDFPDIEAVAARKPVSVTLRALNKVTAKYQDITIDMGATARYGALEITARFCDKRPPEEFPETTAFIEVVDKSKKLESDLKIAPEKKPDHAIEDLVLADAAQTPKLPSDMIFSGWMFASSPALNGLEHAVYDVWVVDCKTVNVES